MTINIWVSINTVFSLWANLNLLFSKLFLTIHSQAWARFPTTGHNSPFWLLDFRSNRNSAPVASQRRGGALLEFWMGRFLVMQDCPMPCLRLVSLSPALWCMECFPIIVTTYPPRHTHTHLSTPWRVRYCHWLKGTITWHLSLPPWSPLTSVSFQGWTRTGDVPLYILRKEGSSTSPELPSLWRDKLRLWYKISLGIGLLRPTECHCYCVKTVLTHKTGFYSLKITWGLRGEDAQGMGSDCSWVSDYGVSFWVVNIVWN